MYRRLTRQEQERNQKLPYPPTSAIQAYPQKFIPFSHGSIYSYEHYKIYLAYRGLFQRWPHSFPPPPVNPNPAEDIFDLQRYYFAIYQGYYFRFSVYLPLWLRAPIRTQVHSWHNFQLYHNYKKFFDMTTSVDSTLFDEHFTIVNLNDSKYDRVSRIEATSTDSQTLVTFDINTEIYPVAKGETFNLVFASSLALDGSTDDRGWTAAMRGPDSEPTLADMFDYIMYGKIYKFEDAEDSQTM
jgi:DNA-directed RNA polymerase I, II, and III subunit RPABC3